MQQAIGRVSLVIMICALERHNAMVAQLSDALDVHDWDGPADLPYFGIRNAVSHGSGLEVVAPLVESSPLQAHLDAHGEGLFAVVFGVRNLEEALKRAADHGLAMTAQVGGSPESRIIDSLHANNGGPVYPTYPQRFAVHKEAILAPIGGVNLILGQLEPIAAGTR